MQAGPDNKNKIKMNSMF